MSSESHLPTIPMPEDSSLSVIPTSESATAEENRALRLRMLEMWDAWSNGREPPSTIHGFPELIPRTSGTSNLPINYPNTPLGYPTMSAYFVGTPSEVRPQALISGVASNIFPAPPTSATAQPIFPRPSFEPSSFTFQTPPFLPETGHVTTNSYPQQPWYEFTAGQERTVKNPEQEEINRKMKSIEQSLKNIQGLSGQKSVSYADLCMFPHVHLPIGFKTPKFEKYDGHGHPIDHLKRQFQYNVEIAPDRNSLSNFKEKSSESFREYAVKWREQAARVKPPMDETEMVSVFLQSQEADYFQKTSTMGKPFAEAIKIGEMVENGLKTGRILSQSAIRATSQAIQSGSGAAANRKKKEEVAMMASNLKNPRQPRGYFGSSSRTPQHYYPHQDAAYAMTPHPYAVMNAQPQNPESPSYRPGTRCAYHSGAEGHDTEDCWTLKRAVENLIEQKRVVLRDEETPNVTNNPLPAHNNGPVIGMICEDREFDPALKAIIAIADVEKKPKAAAKPAKDEKKSNSTPQRIEKTVEAKTGAVPPKDVVLYVPKAPRKEQFVLSPPKRFELNKGPKMYVPKGTYVARGPVISPRLTEPVVISRAPQKPMKDPTVVPWNYNKAVVTYKGKEIMGEVNETNPSGKYLNLEELNKTKQKRFPLKKPVSAEEAEEFFRKMKTSEYDVIDQLRKSPSQVSLLSLLISSNEHQKVLLKTLNEAYVPVETTVEQLERMAE
ncbi:PREDICTED: uncharacterized protein LOC109224284 [Nicotiana attenuata]|uniref:uncharacterized protein LOC109224284 n=1 Tax=Nicotiana attenuata TaxID=49451 RepID=UPI00090489DA|nr:PREDICTED: uncharacterized protein LOC109224284 [Nicotiana attenuata]